MGKFTEIDFAGMPKKTRKDFRVYESKRIIQGGYEQWLYLDVRNMNLKQKWNNR